MGLNRDVAPSGQLASLDQLQSLLESNLPLAEVVFAFGYGSGVFSQVVLDNDDEQKVVDMIIVVKDSYKFHQANYQRNPTHYTVPFWTSDVAGRATWWQRHELDTRLLRNPKVYFVVTQQLKYGVIQLEDLLDDLKDWSCLYLAGRMHKPTVTVLERSNGAVQEVQERWNLRAALATALLLQSSTQLAITTATPFRVYTQIAALSYTGDFRIAAGAEDPNKISKLVQSPGQYHRFHALYEPSAHYLRNQGLLTTHDDDWSWSWDSSPSGQALLASMLPLRLQSIDRGHLASAIASIVAPAARYQSAKGLVTTGLYKSAVYAARKLSKGILRRR